MRNELYLISGVVEEHHSFLLCFHKVEVFLISSQKQARKLNEPVKPLHQTYISLRIAWAIQAYTPSHKVILRTYRVETLAVALSSLLIRLLFSTPTRGIMW